MNKDHKNHRDYPDLDFAQHYCDYMQEINFQSKDASCWDKKATMMHRTALKPSSYISGFIAAIDLEDVQTILDVGCGPGSLALRLANDVEEIYCLDYSSKMLACLMDSAQGLNLDNITPIWLDKESEWGEKVPSCDIVIASRSGLDADLAATFSKLSAHAKKTVYFSHLVGGHFDCLELSELLDRSRPAFPDYIAAVNILYQMGYDPNLSYLTSSGRLADCIDLDDFMQRMQMQYRQLTENEITKLTAWYHQNHTLFSSEEFAMKWALLSWDVA